MHPELESTGTASPDPEAIRRASLAQLSALRHHFGAEEEISPALIEAFARRALDIGEPLLAWDVLDEARGRPGAGDLHVHLAALALLRAGAVERAIGLLEPLREAGASDEETLGLLARAHKSLWRETGDARHLGRSMMLYSEAWEATGGVWSGINAATLSLCANAESHARAIAREVEARCAVVIDANGEEDPWIVGTLGEAALVLGRETDARRWYAELARRTHDHGTRASVRANARLVLQATGGDAAWLDEVIPGPAIGVFTGHIPTMFLETRGHIFGEPEEDIAARVARAIEGAGIRIGFGAAAAGADILFHEALLARGGECHVVLPQAPGRFKEQSVATAGAEWVRRFDAVLAQAASTVVLGESAPDDLAYVYANRAMLGLARARAQQVDGRLRGFAVWDGSRGPAGGTSSAVADWKSAGLEIAVIGVERLEGAPAGPERPSIAPRRLVSMLFADAVGFSKLVDDQIPAFLDVFLGGVARTLQETRIVPLSKNTWGDGLYLCFDSARAAGTYALALRDRMNGEDWGGRGLPAGMNVRIGLHSGPAFEIFDPVVGGTGYTGAHVSRAARIEPVTPPGEVYASQPFAAMAHYENAPGLRCEYVGNMPMAKGYGQFITYSVRRTRAR